jgi:hypothetical protein
MSDPRHRTVSLPVDVVTLAHIAENVIWALDYAHRHEGGDALGHVPLTHQVCALCDRARLDFTLLSRNALGLSPSDACARCTGAGIIVRLDGGFSARKAGDPPPTKACPACGGTGRRAEEAT